MAHARRRAGNTGASDVLTLYYAPHTCSLASHIALKDAAATYELKRIAEGAM